MNSPTGHEQNADQIAYWNGPGGQRWARPAAGAGHPAGADRRHPDRSRQADSRASASSMSVAAAAPRRSRSRKRSGRQAMCSASMCPGRCWSRRGRARRRTLPIDFVLADATVYPFDPASFDLLASRFGVMFFADPAKSFANMRKALRPSGRLAFACWREPRENPWIMAPLQAVYKHVAETAAARAGRSRTVRVRLGGARASHPGRGRFHRRSRWSRAIWRSISRSAAALRPRCRARSKSDRPAARWKTSRRTIRAAATQFDPRGAGAFVKGDTVPLPRRSGS